MIIQPDRHALLKYGSLSFVVVQNTALILVGVHSRRQDGPQYLGSVAVLLTEVLKTLISLTCALVDSGSGVLSELRGYVVHDPLWVLAFALPSLCYCVHNNLWYVAVTHLDPVTIAVMTQLKIVSAALFSVLLLGRKLGARRWAAIALLVVGLAVVQWHSLRPRGGVGAAAAAAVGRCCRTPRRSMRISATSRRSVCSSMCLERATNWCAHGHQPWLAAWQVVSRSHTERPRPRAAAGRDEQGGRDRGRSEQRARPRAHR